MPVHPPTMRAITQHGYGIPESVLRLAEIQVPVIGADDVLIRMRGTSVNTPDWATVTGVPYVVRLAFGLRRPRRPVRGSDVSGVVAAVGQQVTGLVPGDEVFGSARGTFAQYVVAPAAQLIKKPAGLGFTDDETRSVLDLFIAGGQPTAGGIMQAVSAYAQTVEDPDRAYDIEDKAVTAMEEAAK